MAACGYCIWWRAPKASEEKGECHRRSPLVTGGLHCAVSTEWPQTPASEVCGDFEAKDDF